jgi:hypothetical protein
MQLLWLMLLLHLHLATLVPLPQRRRWWRRMQRLI